MAIPANSTLFRDSGGCETSVPPWRFRQLSRLRVLAAVVLVNLSSVLSAADHLQNVRLRLVNGSSLRGTIDAIDEQGAIEGSAMLRNITLSDVTSLSTGRPVSASSSAPTVRLAAGSVIPFTDIALAGDRVRIARDEQPLNLPLELVREIVWEPQPDEASAAIEPRDDEDVIVVATAQGDRMVGGLLEAIDPTHVVILYQGKSRKILRNKVRAVLPARLSVSQPKGDLATIRLVDGAIIVGTIESYRDQVLTIGLSGQQRIEVPAAKVSRISIQTDRIAWLSDLTPIRSEQQAQFVPARPWQRDRSLLGNPLRLKSSSRTRTREFDKGIGARSYTSIVYRNDNGFSHFRAVVGIDAETEGHGDCEMVLEGDGIRLWSRRVRGTDNPLPIVVDISGIREVALIVLPGEGFDLADHANWADARFTRTD